MSGGSNWGEVFPFSPSWPILNHSNRSGSPVSTFAWPRGLKLKRVSRRTPELHPSFEYRLAYPRKLLGASCKYSSFTVGGRSKRALAMPNSWSISPTTASPILSSRRSSWKKPSSWHADSRSLATAGSPERISPRRKVYSGRGWDVGGEWRSALKKCLRRHFELSLQWQCSVLDIGMMRVSKQRGRQQIAFSDGKHWNSNQLIQLQSCILQVRRLLQWVVVVGANKNDCMHPGA